MLSSTYTNSNGDERPCVIVSHNNVIFARVSTQKIYDNGYDAVGNPVITFASISSTKSGIESGVASIAKKTDNTERKTQITITSDITKTYTDTSNVTHKCVQLKCGSTTFAQINVDDIWDNGGKTAFVNSGSISSIAKTSIPSGGTIYTLSASAVNGNEKYYRIIPRYKNHAGTVTNISENSHYYYLKLPSVTVTPSMIGLTKETTNVKAGVTQAKGPNGEEKWYAYAKVSGSYVPMGERYWFYAGSSGYSSDSRTYYYD